MLGKMNYKSVVYMFPLICLNNEADDHLEIRRLAVPLKSEGRSWCAAFLHVNLNPDNRG